MLLERAVLRDSSQKIVQVQQSCYKLLHYYYIDQNQAIRGEMTWKSHPCLVFKYFSLI